jgi:Zn finger protein HypA/HybF involved in hydrogenase expression
MSIECLECGHKGQPEALNFPESLYGFVEVCPKCKSTNYNVIIDEPSAADIEAIKAQQHQFKTIYFQD